MRAILFGPFRLLPMQRHLLVGERSVRLGGCGDWDGADYFIADLIRLAMHSAQESWVARGRCFLGVC